MQKYGRERGAFGKRNMGLVVHCVLADWGISQTSVAGTPDGRDSGARAILSPVEFGDVSASLDAGGQISWEGRDSEETRSMILSGGTMRNLGGGAKLLKCNMESMVVICQRGDVGNLGMEN